ncbi:hypothetical protein BM221_000129 [Beauveria bassiana]|uniref:Uncharacterized protein n=1 Tax=Beauveria bassiana TaxID=176275 RepID=A0A2N6NZM8_BEABA|nr:hypothetical protein BM221_000129 [Beauveria bassiana]
MPCSTIGVSLDSVTDTDELPYAAIENFQIDRMRRIRKSLRAIEIPTIKKDALYGLQPIHMSRPIACCWPRRRNANTFFAPCDWPLDVLDDQTWNERGGWRNLDHVTPEPVILLKFPMSKMG